MKPRELEISERARALLGVDARYDVDAIKRNFRRQIRLVNPHGPKRLDGMAAGFTNADVARLLIQAYGRLMGRSGPTTMLENDELVGILLNGKITPMARTTTAEGWNAEQYYDQFRKSIWPESSNPSRGRKWKFGGIC